jgi:hypothetical protein
MECTFGCVPSPRYLTREEGFKIISRANQITGGNGMKSTLPELEEVLNAVPRER